MSSINLSYAHGASDVPLLGETIGDNLRRTVERFGDREALVVRHQNVRLTYDELWDLTTRCARGLLAHGVDKGDRVGIWAPNRYEWVVLQFAAARVGAILVNINPAYKTAELEYALNQSGVSLLLLARGFRQSDYVAMLAEVRAAGARICPRRWSSRTTGTRCWPAASTSTRPSSPSAKPRSSSTTRSTSSTPPARRARPRAPRCRTTTSSTTPSSRPSSSD